MNFKKSIFTTLSIVAIFTISCKDQKNADCAKAYDMIKKCLPSLAGQTKNHSRICVETYDKSSTRGSILCAKEFSNCEQFKTCLNYSSLCRDFTGKQFEPCLKSADKCTVYKGAEFKNCIKCVTEKKKAGDELKQCVRDSSSENLPVAPTDKKPDPSDMNPPKGPAPTPAPAPAPAPTPAPAPAPAMK